MPAALGAALADVIGRHEVLRTVFPAVDGQPFQQVRDVGEVGWELETATAGEQELAGLVDGIAAEPFDLAGQIPLRARLLRLGPGVHVLVVVAHHIATDGWSMGVLARDVSTRTRRGGPAACRDGCRCRCSTPTTRSGSGSCWGRRMTRAACWPGRWPGGGRRWRGRLWSWRCRSTGRARRCPATGVTGGAGGPGRGARGGWRRWPGRSGVTLFMVVQAALAVLLAKLGAGDDIVVGTPVAGRTDVALDELVGFFVNTLVLRTDLAGDPVLRAAAGPGARVLAGGAGSPGCAVRAAGGGAGPGPVAGPPSAVPGHARRAEQRPGGAGPARPAGRRGSCRDWGRPVRPA